MNRYDLFKVRAPDAIRYMSTLLRLRDGVHSHVPKTGSTLCGDTPTRLLARNMVQLTDMQPSGDAGRLALGVVRWHQRRQKRLDTTGPYA
jgi:hypothetical protein